MNSNIKYIYVDLFCGAGGTTLGVEQARDKKGRKISKVIACVNHDQNAINSHYANHKEAKHFTEDIRTLDLTELIEIVRLARIKYKNAKLVLWASLECTNFSNAKGGKPKDADSRTLAMHLFRYIDALDPELIQIENVREFMKWSPLDKLGKPIKAKEGKTFEYWTNKICSYGYDVKHRLLNAADFGGYTSRNRLFMCFAKEGIKIVFPSPTHSKKPKNDLFTKTKKWNPVSEVLDFENEGKSIFGRKKELAENTLYKIYDGLLKFSENGDFTISYYGNSKKAYSIKNPIGTITTKDRFLKVKAIKFLYNPQWGGNYRSLDRPCFTLIARMDKAPPYLVHTKRETPGIKINSNDSPAMILIKKFMLKNGISDIKVRMLEIHELLKIQGFPENYILKGTKTEQKKFIGNAVHPIVPKKWIESLSYANL